MASLNKNSNFLDEDLALSVLDNGNMVLNNDENVIPLGSILQIQRVLNVCVPKEDQEVTQSYHPGTDVLKLVLSDGKYTAYALIYHSPSGIGINTAPGTKIRILKPISVTQNVFCLPSDSYEVLGGHVPKLIENWTLQMNLNVKQEWGYNKTISGNPPQWKPFGYKITAGVDISALRNMKAMDIVNKQREESMKGKGEKTEFDLLRDRAVEEVQDKSLKLNWCPPAKNLVDEELAYLLKEGIALEDAEVALKKFKNPKKALKYLRGSTVNEVIQSLEEKKFQPRRAGKNRNANMEDEEADVPREYQAPSANISLFGFIENRIKPEKVSPVKQVNNDDEDEDYQLALALSMCDTNVPDSQFFNSRFDTKNEFPSFQGQSSEQPYNRSKNQRQPTIKRDYPSGRQKYEPMNNNATKSTESSRWPTPDYNQRGKPSQPARGNYNRRDNTGNAESYFNRQSYRKDTSYSRNDYKPDAFKNQSQPKPKLKETAVVPSHLDNYDDEYPMY